MSTDEPFRVLSLDGGGMRGTYTATYLQQVADGFSKKRGVGELDIGGAFSLIVGTSTGGIVACALAAGVRAGRVASLYRAHGASIFRRRLPSSPLAVISDLWARSSALEAGTDALRSALGELFGAMTVEQLYAKRRIALAITAVELSQHRSWVFKTPHHENTNHRDDPFKLVDLCLATTAAPLYRALAAVDRPKDNDGQSGYNVFADGGLWANNPVLVGLLEALEIAEPGRRIEVFCLGTCPRPAGEQLPREAVNRGLLGWGFGGHVATLSIDAQEYAYDNIARMFVKHFNRPCAVVRFPRNQVPAALMPYLGLDDTRPEAIDALAGQARTDADLTNSVCSDPTKADGRLTCSLFNSMPVHGVGRTEPGRTRT